MASQQSQQFLVLENAEDVDAFFLLLESKLQIEKVEKDGDKVLRLVSLVGLDAIKKISKICLPKKITELTYKEVKEKIMAYVKPTKKLIMAERTKFFSLRQEKDENIKEFVTRLRNQSSSCDFESLKQVDNLSESMVVHQLICGLSSKHYQERILESTATKTPTVVSILDLVENLNQISKFCENKESAEVMVIKHNEKTNISKRCTFCGNNWHQNLKDCPAKLVKCHNCGCNGHFSKCCRKVKQKHVKRPIGKRNINNISDVFHVTETNFINSRYEILYINNQPVKFLLDTGATVSLIPTRIFDSLDVPLDVNDVAELETYDGHKLECVGTSRISVIYKNEQRQIDFKVVRSQRDYGLLGRDMINAEINTVREQSYLSPIKGVKASVRLKPGSTSTFCKARRIPIPLELEVSQTLETLEKKGVIEKTSAVGIENTSPVVWVRKKSGQLRMCPDYKVHLNRKIYSEDYPLPTMDAIFSKLAGAKRFATIDLKDAYWQIEIDDESQKICAINTSKGVYKVKRLMMGLKNSAAIFQDVIENTILKGLKNVIAYQDDIVVFAKTEESLKKHLNATESRLREKGVTVNEAKLVRNVSEIEYLGRIISADGIRPNENHLNKALNLKQPENRKEVQSIMGFFNFFREFIPKFSEKTLFLTDKLNGEDFIWKSDDELSLANLKQELLKEPVLKPYDESKEILIETDASLRAVAAIVTQENHPVAYLSKKLTPSQSKWSNIEREAYGIFWAITKLRRVLLGRKFTIQTDHKPLIFIFSSNSSISTRTSARISRWALELMPFDFDIKHKAGKDLTHVDVLSRFSQNEEAETVFQVDEDKIPFNENSIYQEIKLFAEENADYQRLKVNIRNGRWSKDNSEDRKFFKYRWHLTIENDIIYHGTKLYIPTPFQESVIQQAHETHSGRQAMENNIKSNFWWPNLYKDIFIYLRKCEECAKRQPIRKSFLSTWPTSGRWERLHIDWAMPSNYGPVFIAVDAGTNYIDAIPCNDRSLITVKRCLSRLFALFGLPSVIVSDNAPEFVSLKDWLETMGTRLMHSPPYNPASNGQAERAVRTVKDALKSYHPKLGDKFIYLQKVLLNHRACSAKVSPTERLCDFKPRTTVNTNFSPGQHMILKNAKLKRTEPVKYLVQAGQNTAWVRNNEKTVLASLAQLQPIYTDDQLHSPMPWRSKRKRTKPQRFQASQGRANDMVPKRKQNV